MDPVRYTGVSVYTVFFNNPVYFVDPFGAEGQGSDACPECSTPLVFEVVANKIGPGFASSIVMNAIVGYKGPGSFRVPMSLPMVTSEQDIPDQNSESRQLLDYFSNNIPIYSPMEDFQHQVDAGNFTQAYISLARAYVDAFTFRSLANSKGSSSRTKYHKPKLSSGGSPNVMLNQSTNKSVLNILMPDGIAIGTVEAREASIRTVTKKEAEVLISQLMKTGATAVDKPRYQGQWFDIPGVGGFGIRSKASEASKRLGTPNTIDLDIPNIPIDKIKY